MRSFRWTFVFMVLIAALATFTYRDYQKSQKEAEREEEARNVVPFSTDHLTRVEILRRGSDLVLEKRDDRWFILEPIEDLADQQAVTSLMLSLRNEKIIATVAEGSEIASLETYGLTDPITRLKLKSKDEGVVELKIGGKAYDSNLYAQINEDQKVLLISYSWDSHLAKAVKDLRDKHLLRSDLKIRDVKRIVFKFGAGSNSWSYELARQDDGWKVVKGAPDFPVAMDKVDFYLDAVKGVRAQDFVEKSKPESLKPAFELSLYSEAKKPAFHARFTSLDAASGTLKASSSDYSEVLILAKAMLDSVQKFPENFYDRKKPFHFSTADIAKIEVVSPRFKGGFEKKDGKWESLQPDPSKQVDQAKIDQAIAKVQSFEAMRVLHKAQGSIKNESLLKFYKPSGELLFEMGWGAIVIEKAKAGRPESQYLTVRTNQVENLLGLPEAEVKALDIENWVKPVENEKGNSDVRNPGKVPNASRSGWGHARLLASLPFSR